MIKTLETHLKPEDMIFPGGECSVILDFMSKIRSFKKLTSFKNFREAINSVLSASKNVCLRSNLHIVFDSYVETSIKSAERFRRCHGKEALDLIEISEDFPIPQQLDKFWSSSANKTKLQQLARQMAFMVQPRFTTVIGGCVVDEEIKPAHLLDADRRESN